MRRSMNGLSRKISAARRSTAHEISARGSDALIAANVGSVWTTSPMLLNLMIKIRIIHKNLTGLTG